VSELRLFHFLPEGCQLCPPIGLFGTWIIIENQKMQENSQKSTAVFQLLRKMIPVMKEISTVELSPSPMPGRGAL
jgi:hypothetical protein